MGRLTAIESGTIQYTCDADGNLLTKGRVR